MATVLVRLAFEKLRFEVMAWPLDIAAVVVVVSEDMVIGLPVAAVHSGEIGGIVIRSSSIGNVSEAVTKGCCELATNLTLLN